MKVDGLNVIITGGAAGIGLETARLLLEEGVSKCAILDIDDKSGKAVKSQLSSEFGEGRVIFEKCDVANKTEFEEAVDKVMDSLGKLDIFINNAGIEGEERWEKILKINLEGAIIGSQLAMKYMAREFGKAGGTIVNICSVLGLSPMMWPVYCACKSGLIGYTRCIADDISFMRTGVRVMALCPGPTETKLIMGSLEKAGEMRRFLEMGIQDQGGMQSPTDVAKCVLQIFKTGNNGTIWISLKKEPAYEFIFPSI